MRLLAHNLYPGTPFHLPLSRIWVFLWMPKRSMSPWWLCFNLHLLWIFWRVLIDMLAPYRKGKSGRAQPRPSIETTSTRSSVDENEPQVVLPSSTELFYFYGQSLEQCAKLSTGKALFDLCALHKKWLRIYAGELEASSTSVLSFLHSLRY